MLLRRIWVRIFFLRMILVEIGLDKVDRPAFAVDHELFEHVDNHLFLLAVELLLALVL